MSDVALVSSISGSVAIEVFLVTGAASGIGRHWAAVLQAEGDQRRRLVLADLDERGLRASFRESETVRLHALDVRSVEQWTRVVEDTLRRFGRIDYLFNIAGGGRPGPLLDVPMEDVDAQVDLNLKGPIYGMKTVGPVMVRQGCGHIVNVSSLAGIAPTPGNALYSAAKSGLRAVSIASAIRLRDKGVRVTVVCPDLVDTPTVERHMSLDPEDVALIYSGPGPLQVERVEHAFRVALRTGRLEIALPKWRGWLVKVNNLVPPLMPHLYPLLMRRGLANLEALKQQRAGTAAVRLRTGATLLRRAGHFIMHCIARIDVAGAENLPPRGPALLVFNQLSILDTALMTMLGGGRDVTGLVAWDYRRKLIYRLLLEGGGSIWIRRGSPDRHALRAALVALSHGWLVAISPEGRRSPTGSLVEAKEGPAFLARRAAVPIVPVAITNTHRVGMSLRRLRRAQVAVTIGKPFRLKVHPRGCRKDVRRDDTDLIMRRLAALLPRSYRGVYSESSTVVTNAET